MTGQEKQKGEKQVQYAASILGCDLLRIGDELMRIHDMGVSRLHFDSMDGLFVDNFSFGNVLLEPIRIQHPDFHTDVHIMSRNPAPLLHYFARADHITVHAEAIGVPECLKEIGKMGIKSGIAINPETPAEVVYDYLDRINMILVMGVTPGLGGQKFLPQVLPKIQKLRQKLDTVKGRVCPELAVDGGINNETAVLVREAGADVLVSGSHLFNGRLNISDS
ncbi:ribulose-phosphate 3-epimerase [Clostridia bacterium]|nr:ribulose-phosphate 3-epimerase [Clostridia bacterium]